MLREEFDSMLRDSAFLRESLVDLQRATEQALAIFAVAVSRQVDAAKLESELLERQQIAAARDPSPTRDHFLNLIRERIRG